MEIMDKNDNYEDVPKSKFDKYIDSLSEKTESIRNGAHGLVDVGKEKYYAKKENAVSNF